MSQICVAGDTASPVDKSRLSRLLVSSAHRRRNPPQQNIRAMEAPDGDFERLAAAWAGAERLPVPPGRRPCAGRADPPAAGAASDDESEAEELDEDEILSEDDDDGGGSVRVDARGLRRCIRRRQPACAASAFVAFRPPPKKGRDSTIFDNHLPPSAGGSRVVSFWIPMSGRFPSLGHTPDPSLSLGACAL